MPGKEFRHRRTPRAVGSVEAVTTSGTTQAPTRHPHALAWAALAAAVAQVVSPAVQALADLGAPASAQGDELLITPAGYTFSIWSLVYLLSFGYAVAVVVTRTTGTPMPGRLLRDLVCLYVGAAVWIVVAAAGSSWATAMVLLAMVVVAVDAAWVASRESGRGAGPAWLPVWARATGVYAGWVTAAAVLNVCGAVVEGDVLDGGDVGWQGVALVVTVVVALTISALIGGSWAYAATLVWAFAGVAVAVRDVSGGLVVVAVAGAVVVALANAVLITRRR